MASGPPYPPTTWSLGGQPKRIPDIPLSSVFLVLYIGAAVTHMTILQLNQRRAHKFLMSGLMFGFCMARVVTMVLRIASICKPHNVSLAIAAMVFLNAGVVILFAINIAFAHRMIRAAHPHVGWNPIFSACIKSSYFLIVISIAMLITAVIQSFFTLNKNTRRIDRDIQLYGTTFFAFISFLPIPLVVFGLLIPRRSGTKLDKFGRGRWRVKVAILLTSSVLLCLGAAYRASTAWHKPVPRTEPMPNYFARGALYAVNFTIEIIVVYLYAIVRVDRRFHVPNGAHGPGSYSRGAIGAKDEMEDTRGTDEAEPAEPARDPPPNRIFSEEETFDDMDEDRNGAANGAAAKDPEKGAVDEAGTAAAAHR